jgi:hypothetical protein
MQLPEKKGKQNAAEEGQQQDPQLSETWRALLGLQPSDETGEQPQIDPSAQVQPLASDPWNDLQHASGMQPVDLQKVRLHELHESVNDDDVEHALNLMREATGGLPALREKKSGEA